MARDGGHSRPGPRRSAPIRCRARSAPAPVRAAHLGKATLPGASRAAVATSAASRRGARPAERRPRPASAPPARARRPGGGSRSSRRPPRPSSGPRCAPPARAARATGCTMKKRSRPNVQRERAMSCRSRLVSAVATTCGACRRRDGAPARPRRVAAALTAPRRRAARGPRRRASAWRTDRDARSRVSSSDCRRRQRRMRAWLPDSEHARARAAPRKLGRPRVVRMLEQRRLERLLERRVGVAEHAGQPARHRVDDDHRRRARRPTARSRRSRAPRRRRVDHALVDAFVAAAHQRRRAAASPARARVPASAASRPASAGCGARGRAPARRLDRGEQRLGPHHHARRRRRTACRRRCGACRW